MSHDHGGHSHEIPLILRSKKKRRVGNSKPMRFVSLHHHTTFSYLDGYQLPEAHVRRVAELNMNALAITEHGNVSSHVKLEKAALERGIKPIFGCEIYTGGVTPETRTQSKYHLTVIAENEVGYRNLLQLVTKSYAEGFYYHPTVSWEMLREHKEGLIVLSGCQGSVLFCSAVGGKLIAESDASYARAKKVAAAFKRELGDRYYIELQGFPELEKTCEANPILAGIADDLKIPLVATLDCHYTEVTDREMQKILHNIRPGNQQTIEDQAREWGYKAALCPPANDKSIYRKMMATGISERQAMAAVVNTEVIAQRCNVTLPSLPMVRYPYNGDNQKLWQKWIQEGWHYRKCDQMPRSEREKYRERLLYEMGLIEEKDFIDYFLVVSDAVKFAKDSGVPVGPARGSAAASLVCWLLRITEVNPMLFPNLVFERFIDSNRMDLPDIDLDFDSDRRGEVHDYLVAKYGKDCVGNIGTFTTYKAKLALDDVARVYRIPKFKVETIKGLLLERNSGDMRATDVIEDTVNQFDDAREVIEEHQELALAMDLEGNVKGSGVHAAGLVVSNDPINRVCAVYSKKINGVMREVVSLDKYDAERQGLLKMDFLGLSTMAMIAEAIRLIGMSLEDLYSVDLTDEKTIRGFIKNDVAGVFQFDGGAMRQVNGSLKSSSFKEICDVNAIARPGPLHSGAAEKYIAVKNGGQKAPTVHPALDAIAGDTNGQIIYQEQILRIVREIGNFSWTHAAYIRKIISRKIGEYEFNKQKEAYLEGALSIHERTDYRRMTKDEAELIWSMCITAGSYAFNAAHSTAYGMLAFWTMWIKQHYPTEFYAASLSKMPRKVNPNSGVDNHMALMRDAMRHNIRLLPPDPALSGVTWQPSGEMELRGGLCQVDGIAEKTAQTIIDYREQEQGSLSGWDDLIKIKGIGPKKIEAIKAFTADDGLDDHYKVLALDRKLDEVRAELHGMVLKSSTHTCLQVPSAKGSDTEIVWVGEVLQVIQRDIFEQARKRGGELDPSAVKDSHLTEFALIRVHDGDESMNVRVDRWKYPKFKLMVAALQQGDIIYVEGVKPGWRDAREVYANRICVIETTGESGE